MPPETPAHSSFAIDVPGTLLARARAGERAAIEQLYRWFERPVFTLALRICGDREEASEVLQDTMLKVIDRVHGFRGESPFWGWLRQIAVNEALMRLRRVRLHPDGLDLELHEPTDEVTPPPPCSARWHPCPRRPAACCGSTTPRAIRMRRSAHSWTAPRAFPSRSSRAAPAACARCSSRNRSRHRKPRMPEHSSQVPRDWREAFAALPEESAPPGGWAALSARLDARLPTGASHRRRRARWPMWASGAAALALAIALPWRDPVEPAGPAAPDPATIAAAPTDPLEQLQLESAQLEALLSFAGCAVIISHDRWFLDRVATHVLAFEGDSVVRWFEGNFSDYEADRHRRLGTDADQPHRIKYKPLTRG